MTNCNPPALRTNIWSPLAGRRLAVTVTPLDSAGGRIVLLHDITEAHRLKVQSERHDRRLPWWKWRRNWHISCALRWRPRYCTPPIWKTPICQHPHASTSPKNTIARLKHLERLIQDMLLFARGEVLGREAVNVQEMLDELHHTLERLARSRHIDFSVIRAQDVLPTWHGNRKAVVGGLVNLLENALHATAAAKNTGTMQDATPGKVTLTADCDDNHTLIFRIRDNGCGMPPSVVSRLFEPFFTTRTEGTGLGLAIARGVIRAHQGEIRGGIHRRCGYGIHRHPATAARSKSRYRKPMNEPLNLLVVEDDDALRDALLDHPGGSRTHRLWRRWRTTSPANAGQENLQHGDPSDLRMSPMNGLELLHEIRAGWPTLPVLLMTASRDVDKAVAAMRGGACDFMMKPFEPKTLLEQIARYAVPPASDSVVAKMPARAKSCCLLPASHAVKPPSC